jgi:hypothetical protein
MKQNVAAAVAGNVAAEQLSGQQGNAGVAELAYATDLKSVALTRACGFKSRRQHHLEAPNISDLKSHGPKGPYRFDPGLRHHLSKG